MMAAKSNKEYCNCNRNICPKGHMINMDYSCELIIERLAVWDINCKQRQVSCIIHELVWLGIVITMDW